MKQVLEIEEGIDALFRFATEGIIITSLNGEISRINPFAEKMFGYEKDELLGQKIEILVPKRLSDSHTKDRESYKHNPKIRHLDSGLNLCGLRKNGTEFPAEIALNPFTNNNGSFVIAFVIDITIRKQAEDALLLHSSLLEKEVANRTKTLEKTIQELEKTKVDLKNALLKEQELNDLKSRFITTASHEFRTPLTTMQSSIALVSRYNKTGDLENQAKHLDKIKENISLLTSMLDEFLSLKKLEESITENKNEEGNLKWFLKGIISEMQPMLLEQQTCNLEYVGNEIVWMNYKAIKSILLALVSNAIRYSNENGHILISCIVNNTSVEISVKDNGIGILEEDKTHIFDQFFRGSNATHIQGTGLGLNIVQKYIQQMNAQIFFESELNKGSKFTITVPLKL